jgi:cytosine/adenosine deaminase-related metal-dependent hydrolase
LRLNTIISSLQHLFKVSAGYYFMQLCVFRLCSYFICGGKFTIYQLTILYRKFKADDIFTGTAFTGAGKVLIMNEDGRTEGIVEEADAGEGIEAVEGMISPGFINAHCHLELSHMKGMIAEGTGLVDFVQAVMSSRGGAAEEIQQAIKDAEQEMYNNGIVAAGDICNTTDTIAAKSSSKIHWHNFIEVSGFVDAAAQKRFDAAEEILKAFKDFAKPPSGFSTADGASTLNLEPSTFNSLSPHAPYSVSKTLFGLLNEATENQLITIHNQESKAEDELYKAGKGKFLELYKNFGIDISSFVPTGKSSFETWTNYFDKNQLIISVHNTFTNESDLHSSFNTHHSSFNFCLCPNANLYIERSLPPVEMLMNNGCSIALGTDSYASNHQLDIASEINVLRRNFPQIPLEKMLQWATLNGAKALQMENMLGSFEKGKIPGVLQLTNNRSVLKGKRIL